MGLLDDLAPVKRTYPCKVRDEAAKLSPDDAKILLEATENPAWSIHGLVSQLNKRGLQINAEPIRRHREKACSCWKI